MALLVSGELLENLGALGVLFGGSHHPVQRDSLHLDEVDPPPAETWIPDAVFTFHANEPDVTFVVSDNSLSKTRFFFAIVPFAESNKLYVNHLASASASVLT